MKSRDWSNEKVGLLKPLYVSGSDNGAIWMCLCDCGNKIEKSSSKLSSAKNKGYKNTSCGCVKSNQIPELIRARKNGDTRYFTGKPCANGHVAERRVKGRQCVECSRLKDLEIRPDRLEYFKEYQKKNSQKAIAACRRYNEKNRDKRRAEDAKRRSSPGQKKKRAEWQRCREQAKRSGSKPVSRHAIIKIHKMQKEKCANCGNKVVDYHVDHIEPISRGGSNDIENLQILCPQCNLKKGAKDPLEWARMNGRLL